MKVRWYAVLYPAEAIQNLNAAMRCVECPTPEEASALCHQWKAEQPACRAVVRREIEDVCKVIEAVKSIQQRMDFETPESRSVPTLTIVADSAAEAAEKLREAGKRAVQSVTITPERAEKMLATIDAARQKEAV